MSAALEKFDCRKSRTAACHARQSGPFRNSFNMRGPPTRFEPHETGELCREMDGARFFKSYRGGNAAPVPVADLRSARFCTANGSTCRTFLFVDVDRRHQSHRGRKTSLPSLNRRVGLTFG